MNKLALIAATGFFAIMAPAFAWKAYHLEGSQYAILCDDGAIFTYSGSGSGLSISGNALCEGHGGIAGGGGPTGGIQQATPMRQSADGGSTNPPGSGPAQAGSAYIHRPDSTQYHPGNQTRAKAGAAPAARADGYRHRPNSTQYRPGGGQPAAAASSAYIHRPDSTQYHPGNGQPAAAATSAYIHRPDSTQYHPSSKKK
jgi:hypothetical protein